MNLIPRALQIVLAFSLVASAWGVPPDSPNNGGLWNIHTATVGELLEILSQPDRIVSTQPRRRARSAWDEVKSHLRTKLETARPALIKMLKSDSEFARANALDVLAHDDPEHKRKLETTAIKLLDDPAQRVRISAVRYLAPIASESVQEAFVRRIAKLDPSSESDGWEIVDLLGPLCRRPAPPKTLAAIFLRILNNPMADDLLLANTIKFTRPYLRSPFGEELLERYWKILSTTDDTSIPYVVTNSLADDDDRTLPYLRDTPTIQNDTARSYATGKLIAHKSFDLGKDKALLDQLLTDRHARVRRAATLNFCNRTDGDPTLQIAAALKLFHTNVGEPNNIILQHKFYSLDSLLRVLARMPEQQRNEVLRDPTCEIPRLMITHLTRREHSPLIVSGSHFLV